MVGITSFGGYIPRRRLSRKIIFQNIGWLNPATAAVSQGEKAMCNWDEDSLTMAVAAARDCLVGQNKGEVDSLYLASTTLPFADRLNAGIVATALNLRDDIYTADITSSQRAGISALVAGLRAVKSGEGKKVLVAAADKRDTKCASSYEMLFGDGAASLLLGDEDVVAEFKGSYSMSFDFIDHYRGQTEQFDHTWEERWTRDEGYAKIVPQAVNGLLTKLGISMAEVDKLIFPCLFKREHAAIAKAVGATPDKVVDNLHEVCGETGAAHPLVMLVATLEAAKPGERILVAGYGQGCEALYFQVTDKILDLPRRVGIRGSLANKLATDSYMKFLAFRNLITTDLGARAEVGQPTALSTLWRNHKMITGLVGGKCQTCDTPQYPKADICVNPECGAVGTQVDYEFGDEPAIVKTYTGDMLAASIDPPNIYGMVEFKDGGRFMADFTDCKLDEIKVGMPMRMTFRKHLDDRGRGFTGYFWKAVPVL